MLTRIALSLWILSLALPASAAQAQRLSGPYIDPRHLTALPFGTYSHWLQPWRAYQETVPAHAFLNAIGVGLDGDDSHNFDLIVQMLAKYGFRHARIEIGWSSLDFDDRLRPDRREPLRRRLLACQRYGVRPLILLNAHSGAPCPIQFFERTLAAPARKGDRRIELTDVSDLRIGYSGLNNLTEYWACEAFVTGIEGNTVTLSKPLPKDLGDAGTKVSLSTLKYRPFSVPGSDDHNATIAGWQRYVGETARFVTETLGTQSKPDRGFDLEIWNELSFGSRFLQINAYYAERPYVYHEDRVWSDVVRATADYAEAHPDTFRGVTLCDGFSNTIPWPASSTQPPRIGAMSKHPYAGRKNYPGDERRDQASINALFQPERPPVFLPEYTALFPEYYATALQTETLVRDMGPITNTFYGTPRGRYARVVNGRIVPCWLWITEVGFAPDENGIKDRSRALRLKAKTTARYYCFYVNKGVQRLYLYAALAGDTWLGVVQDNYIAFAKSSNTYPKDDSAYVSPAMRTLGRIVQKMRAGLDPKLAKTRDLKVLSIRDTHGRYQFRGRGNPEHPTLYNREVFAFLPYQVNARRFVIPYYVMTRDVSRDLRPERYEVRIGGVRGEGAAVLAYDPLTDRSVPVTVRAADRDSLTLLLTAADYPYLLTIQEKPTGSRR
jgi:hypothetical protein